jgi:hypothetical protein
MQCSHRGHYIGKGFERSARLVYGVNAAVHNRSVLCKFPSPVLVTTSLVGTYLSPYVRQSNSGSRTVFRLTHLTLYSPLSFFVMDKKDLKERDLLEDLYVNWGILLK